VSDEKLQENEYADFSNSKIKLYKLTILLDMGGGTIKSMGRAELNFRSLA